MSVTIHWRPTADKGRRFEGGTSADLEALKRTFGYVIGASDRPALIAMANASRNDFYLEVAKIIDEVGTIEIWGEY